MPNPHNTFDDNTLCITISLAEYRELVRHEAISGSEIDLLRNRLLEAGRERDDLVAQIQALQEKLEGTDDEE